MSVPNLKHIVQGVRDRGGWNFTTKDGLCAYSHAVKVALHTADNDFGELKKSDAQNHCVDPQGRNCAVDVALYRPTGQVIDFIKSAGFGSGPRPADLKPNEPWPPTNDVVWGPGPEGEYTADKWFMPVAGPATPGEPIPATEPSTPPADLAPLLHRLADLEQRAVQLGAGFAEVSQQIGALNEQLKALSVQPAPGAALHTHVVRLGPLTLVTGPPR